MKKILLLLLFISTSLYAQIPIGQPIDLLNCNDDGDGAATFDLTVVEMTVLNGLNPSEYSIGYYTTLLGAETEEGTIEFPMSYANTTSSEIIYMRVEEVADPSNFVIESFELRVNAPPVFSINDITICEGAEGLLDTGLEGLYVFQWYKDDVGIGGTIGGSYLATEAGTYSVVVTHVLSGCSYEDSAVVTVIPGATASIVGYSVADQSVAIQIEGTPNATVTFTNDSISSALILDATGFADVALPFIPNSIFCLISVTASTVPECTMTLSNCIALVENPEEIVNIPDANFKAKLLAASGPNIVDLNNDGEIQLSEAVLITSLDVRDSFIASLLGIEKFINLKTLFCSNNQINTLDISLLNELEYLNCAENLLTLLDVSNNSNIRILHFSGNQISTIDLSNLLSLDTFNCDNNLMNSVDLSQCLNLKYVDIGSNDFSSIDVSMLTQLTQLYVDNNQLTNLELGGLENLIEIHCDNNLLTTLDFTSQNQLTSIVCYSNLLTSITNLQENNLLAFLHCSHNSLTDLNLEGLVNLEYLYCTNNQIVNLDIEEQVKLTGLQCGYNNLVTIDCSTNILLGEFSFEGNESLNYLFLKNGKMQNIWSSDFASCPNLQYACLDEYEISFFQLWNPGLACNTYCSFTPGGNYNTITGSVVFDFDNNGCTDNDARPFIKMNINNGTEQGTSFADENGNYIFYTQEGSFTLTPQLENPSLYTVSPASVTLDFASIDNSVSTNNFCITANGVQPNAEIVVAPVTPARPGFDAEYKIVFKNTGNQMLSGQVYFYYEDGVLDLVSTSEPTSAQATGLLTWNYTDLHPFESRSINVILNVNGPMETPAINNGDELMFNVGLNPINNNEIVFSYPQIVVGSFDPNDIICLEGESEAPSAIGNYLHYIVNFENTGTAPAENVVVKVEIDATKYDLPSLQLLNGSHPVEARVNNNIAEFIFKTINLETNGHGNILLKIKSKESLSIADTVTKKANIFFDYNFPILTNDANTTFQDLSVAEHLQDKTIAIYPNPSRDIVNIEASSVIHSVQVYDVQGRLLMTHLASDFKTRIDITDKASGVYFFRVQSDKGIKVEKIIKK